MPGLFGFAHTEGDPASAESLLEEILKDQSPHPKHFAFPAFSGCIPGGTMAAGLVLRQAGLGGAQWCGADGVRVWVDGEAFTDTGCMPGEALAESLAYHPLPTEAVWNGAWSAVVYDPGQNEIRFVTDPYGLKHLYVRDERLPAWSGSLTGFLKMPGPPVRLREAAVPEFLEHGHLLGAETWFEGIRLMEPGTVKRYNLTTQSWSEQRYFALERQLPSSTGTDGRSQGPDYAEAVEVLGKLLRQAIVRRADPTTRGAASAARIGLTLSGGLDSRAILAAFPAPSGASPHAAPETLTFGRPGCPDEVLAQAACRVRGAPHTFIPLGEEGWLAERAPHVYGTDGQINILHLHGMESLPALEDRMDVSLNGFLGDALLGGSYLDASKGGGFAFLERYRQRGRRFILQAMHYGGTSLHYRLPFMDTELLRYALGLPREWIRHSRIYRDVLLREFPGYFRTIPWENTGLPISDSRAWAARPREFLTRVSRGLGRRANRLRSLLLRKPTGATGFADYPTWLRQESALKFLRSNLEAQDALLPRYLPEGEISRTFRAFESGAEEPERLGRQLTVELWLRSLDRANIILQH